MANEQCNYILIVVVGTTLYTGHWWHFSTLLRRTMMNNLERHKTFSKKTWLKMQLVWVLKLRQLVRNWQVQRDSKTIQAGLSARNLQTGSKPRLNKGCILNINIELQQHISLNTALYKYYTTYYNSMLKCTPIYSHKHTENIHLQKLVQE